MDKWSKVGRVYLIRLELIGKQTDISREFSPSMD